MALVGVVTVFIGDFMKKQLSAIALLAGTAIGSGMLSLPLILAKYGLLFGCAMMVAFVWVAYFSSIIRAELNIYSNADFALKDVGTHFSGKVASQIGNVSLKLLSYALISAYLHGLASLLNVFWAIDLKYLIALISVITIILLYFSNSLISKINKVLFICLISTFILVTLGMLLKSGMGELKIPRMQELSLNSFSIALPIIFTSFGFQGSLHSLTKFVNNDRKIIKRACLFGSIIPAIVYICWLCSTILIIYNNDPALFCKMTCGNIEISEMIMCLSHISNLPYLKNIFWGISLLALLTSIIGVGIALFDEWNRTVSKIPATIITILPSTIVAICVPNAFIRILGVSGMILAVLAIFLPTFLYFKMLSQRKEIDISLPKKCGICVLLVVGIAIFIAGFF